MKKSLQVILFFTTILITAQEFKFGKVSKAELEERFYPLDSTADAAYLFRKRRTYFEYDNDKGGFKIITEIHNRIKIYNKKGFNFAVQSINYYAPSGGKKESLGFIKGVTFRLENGKIIKDKLSKKNIFDVKLNKYRSVRKITLPNVEEGCIIDLKYKLTSPYVSIKDVEFQFAIPVKELNYSLEIPEYYVYKRRNKGYFFIEPKTSTKVDKYIYKYSERGYRNKKQTYTGEVEYDINTFNYSSKNIPALENNEPYVGSIRSYRGGVKFELQTLDLTNNGGGLKNYSNNWENVSKQIYNSPNFGSELKKTNYYKNDLQSIIANVKSDFEKILIIFQFVKTKIKWNGTYGKYTDNGVRKAYKESSGNIADINLVLTSMLRSAGLNANPVLVSSRGNGVPLFPTIDGFDYVVSMVSFLDNTYVLLDASELYSLPNVLPLRALNWNGRVVANDGNSSWVKLTPTKHRLEDNTVMTKISDDLLVEGFIRTKYDNLNALNFRKNNNHIKDESLITKFEEKNKIEIDNFKIINKNKINNPIGRNVKFVSEDLVEEINGKLYIEPLLFLTQHTNPFKLEGRKFPVDFATPWKDRNTVSIQIPEGYKIESLPETLAIGLPNNLGVFKYQVQQLGNKIKTTSILQFNESIITPEYYSALKEFFGEVVKKQSEKIILIKG